MYVLMTQIGDLTDHDFKSQSRLLKLDPAPLRSVGNGRMNERGSDSMDGCPIGSAIYSIVVYSI